MPQVTAVPFINAATTIISHTSRTQAHRSQIHRAVREVGERPVPYAPELRRVCLLPQERMRPAAHNRPRKETQITVSLEEWEGEAEGGRGKNHK